MPAGKAKPFAARSWYQPIAAIEGEICTRDICGSRGGGQRKPPFSAWLKCRDGGCPRQESQSAATAFTQEILEIERMAAGLAFKVAHGVQDASIENDCSPNMYVF